MTDKFNAIKKKNTAQPHDAKISEKCEKCSDEVVYRNSSYFGKRLYYKICNSCGWYRLMDRNEWREVVARSKESAKAAQQTADDEEDDYDD